ncbi:uncharacterized protein BO95DRAFT_410847 [Aspergillus brunneoviolaceus CBS 621.78]|uniref:Uncharacterized protein n=1 Tax=Aspergillus brunneoviolaceus CBS 621.78 TaxID=1450534 RepID=A0ACD1GD02_9EURO|nr:hypothetical protein BO95DRAFT_410847 [Aspergillus brunneoviolaceus CBS 621.78]RAH47112.1 hypothetical protein BO95DRAFT_410847 [Aspergillus brunneoviolaceus CBS 621.78]
MPDASQRQLNPSSPIKTRLHSGKRVGRPRIEAGGPAILSEDRRTQIRRAQKTYRLKKEAVFRQTLDRVTDLEAKLHRLSDQVSSTCEAATEARLQLSHPDIYARLTQMRGVLIEQGASHGSAFQTDSSRMQVQQEPLNPPRRRQHSLPRPISTRGHTYSFQEGRFARGLQRYCLEHAFNLFIDPQSNPQQVYRVFRLVPCIQDKAKMQPRFEQLLRGGSESPLEVPGLPFYGVGGAGTHYPDKDEFGIPMHPKNMRLPRRVLGILPSSGRGDELTSVDDRARLLEICGLGGQWFDSRDVEGYLEQHGVDLQGSSFFPTVRIVDEPSGRMRSEHRSYVLDLENFLWRLLHGFVILGRAPGFRMIDSITCHYDALNSHLRTILLSLPPNPRPSPNTSTMVTLQEQLAVEARGLDRFISCLPPTRMGDLADWAYGGNILAIAISAAYATTKPGHHLYSLTGHFVRPASPSLKLICQVERIRNTRIFQTRHLRVYQESPTGEQLCLVASADFHIEETLEMVNYSTRPHSTHADAVTAAIARAPESGLYKYINRFMEVQPLPATNRKTEGDITGIISAECFRLQTPLGSESAQLAALAFYMDRGLAYIPANHAGRSLLDASACATLDFALRMMTHRVDVGEWMVSEQQTCAAGGARALMTEAGWMWDRGGRLVANMTQQCILRPKRELKAVL